MFALTESVLDLDQSAAYLRISVSGLYRLVRSGKLKISKIGNRSVISGRELERFTASL
jgi:excisionase family DNA binding protein